MLIDHTADPMIRLLVDVTRRAETHGAALAHAHREVGRALASCVARHVTLEEATIEHVTGTSVGVRIREGEEPIVLAMLRAGLFLAEGVWERFARSSLVLHDSRADTPPVLPASNRVVVVVDAVINTGKSLRALLDPLEKLGVKQIVIVALVGYRPTVELLVSEKPHIDVVVARLSDRSFVGRGPTDTGGRLFGTTTWGLEP